MGVWGVCERQTDRQTDRQKGAGRGVGGGGDLATDV